MKAWLKKAATRTHESLIEAIQGALGGGAEDAQGWFVHYRDGLSIVDTRFVGFPRPRDPTQKGEASRKEGSLLLPIRSTRQGDEALELPARVPLQPLDQTNRDPRFLEA